MKPMFSYSINMKKEPKIRIEIEKMPNGKEFYLVLSLWFGRKWPEEKPFSIDREINTYSNDNNESRSENKNNRQHCILFHFSTFSNITWSFTIHTHTYIDVPALFYKMLYNMLRHLVVMQSTTFYFIIGWNINCKFVVCFAVNLSIYHHGFVFFYCRSRKRCMFCVKFHLQYETTIQHENWLHLMVMENLKRDSDSISENSEGGGGKMWNGKTDKNIRKWLQWLLHRS